MNLQEIKQKLTRNKTFLLYVLISANEDAYIRLLAENDVYEEDINEILKNVLSLKQSGNEKFVTALREIPVIRENLTDIYIQALEELEIIDIRPEFEVLDTEENTDSDTKKTESKTESKINWGSFLGSFAGGFFATNKPAPQPIKKDYTALIIGGIVVLVAVIYFTKKTKNKS